MDKEDFEFLRMLIDFVLTRIDGIIQNSLEHYFGVRMRLLDEEYSLKRKLLEEQQKYKTVIKKAKGEEIDE